MPQHVRVLLFARYAELFGTDVIDVPLPPAGTVADVVALLRGWPGGEGLPDRVLCAVNLRQAQPDAPVQVGDEVAILPPLAGG